MLYSVYLPCTDSPSGWNAYGLKNSHAQQHIDIVGKYCSQWSHCVDDDGEEINWSANLPIITDTTIKDGLIEKGLLFGSFSVDIYIDLTAMPMNNMYNELLRVTIIVGLSSSTVISSNAGSYIKWSTSQLTFFSVKNTYINCRAESRNDGNETNKTKQQSLSPCR